MAPSVQWRAVSTSLLLTRVPPQNGDEEDWLDRSPTCQGYSFSSVGAPPTILVLRLAWPHLQEPVGVGAGDGDGTGEGEGTGEGDVDGTGEGEGTGEGDGLGEFPPFKPFRKP